MNRLITGLLMATCLAPALLAQESEGKPKAIDLLKKAAAHYHANTNFAIDVEGNFELVVEGVPESMDSAYELYVAGPAKYALHIEGPMGGLGVCDGKQTSAYLRGENIYSVMENPIRLYDSALEDVGFMIDTDGVELTLTGLMLEGPERLDEFLEEFQSISALGKQMRGKFECHGVELHDGLQSIEVWFQAGKEPWIREIAIDMTDLMASFGAMMEEADDSEEEPVTIESARETVKLSYRSIKSVPEEKLRFTIPEDAEQVESIFGDLDFEGDFEEEEVYPLLGDAAPAVGLKLLTGEELDLAAHKGKQIVMLDFWATWCPPCVKGLPTMQAISQEYKDKGVVLYAINLEEDDATVKKFLEDKGLELKVGMDRKGAAAEIYAVDGIPTTVLIGKDGRIQAAHIGFDSSVKTTLEQQLDALLRGESLIEEEEF